MRNGVPLDEALLTDPSRRFAQTAFAAHPEWRTHASMECDKQGYYLFTQVGGVARSLKLSLSLGDFFLEMEWFLGVGTFSVE